MLDEVTSVSDIADDDQKLGEKASTSYGEDFILDPRETTGTDFESVDSAVCAILVKKDGGAGAVTSGTFENVVTGPKQGTGHVIIVLKSGKNCMFYGTPSVRYFRRRR
ncbi:MAG: hypothetical protein Q9178_007890 [Gyalolechia marmorata]